MKVLDTVVNKCYASYFRNMKRLSTIHVLEKVDPKTNYLENIQFTY